MKKTFSVLASVAVTALVSCSGKYYNKTSNGIRTDITDNKIFISAIRDNVLYISDTKEMEGPTGSEVKFDVQETESSVVFKTKEICLDIPVNGTPIKIGRTNGEMADDNDFWYGMGDGKFQLSEKGYGKFWDKEGYYFIVSSSVDSVLLAYNSATGNTDIIPKWALGHWQGIKESSNPAEEMGKLRQEHFGVDNIIIGSSDKITEEDNAEIKKMNGHLAEEGTGPDWKVDKSRGYVFSKKNILGTFSNASNWQNLENSVDSIIQYSLSGNKYRTSIIRNDIKEQKLFDRWYQFSVFTPIVCSFCELPRDNSIRYYNKLRYGMIPYIYSLCKTGTIIKPIADHKEIKDQYMFGPSMMVCPVFEKNKRNIFLPDGNIWYDYNHPTNIHEGGQTILVEAPDDRIPVYVPGGGIIIYGQKNEYVSQIKKDDKVDLDIDIYSGKDGYFEIYDDDGTSDKYKNGEFSVIPIQYIDSPRTIIIGARKGKFSGMIPNRNIHVAVYYNGKMKAINVYYEGAKIKISL